MQQRLTSRVELPVQASDEAERVLGEDPLGVGHTRADYLHALNSASRHWCPQVLADRFRGVCLEGAKDAPFKNPETGPMRTGYVTLDRVSTRHSACATVVSARHPDSPLPLPSSLRRR